MVGFWQAPEMKEMGTLWNHMYRKIAKIPVTRGFSWKETILDWCCLKDSSETWSILMTSNDFFSKFGSHSKPIGNRNLTFCMFRIGYFWDSNLSYLPIVFFRAHCFWLPLFNLEEIHFDKHLLSEWYVTFSVYLYIVLVNIYIYTVHCLQYSISIQSTSRAARGGGGSFRNRKRIGEIGCCDSLMGRTVQLCDWPTG